MSKFRIKNHQDEIVEALRDIIQGKTVKRSKHDLTWRGLDLTKTFLEELEKNDYSKSTVKDVDVKVGDRVPAFLIQAGIAYFGWVFWEKFTQNRKRKLWGSVIKNKKGDWDIIIPGSSKKLIYANSNLKQPVDSDNPSGF